jgi:MFS family permease
MDLKERTEQNDGRILEQLKEGFLYAWRLAPIRYILLLVSLVSLMGISCTVLMPLFAKDILGGGPETLGFLMAVVGIGALAGAGCLASRRDIRGLEVMTVASTMILGAGLAVFSFSRILWISMLSLLCVGFGMMVQMVSSNTLLQHITDDDKRGRVMSFYALAFLGVAPFGSLLAGGLAACLGAPNTVLISAFACIAGSLFFAAKVSSINKALAAKLDKEETHPI